MQRLAAEHRWEAALKTETALQEDWTCSLLFGVCVCVCACVSVRVFSLQAEIEHRGELQRQKQQELEEALRFCLVRKFR